MKIVKKVTPLEVKRCFVIGNLCARASQRQPQPHTRTRTEAEYLRTLAKVKSRVLKMPESKLDKIIGGEWIKRLRSYDNSRWYVANAKTDELGVWSKAGELPLRWTNKTLTETAQKVRRALGRKNGFRNRRIRAAHAIPGILKTSIGVIPNEKYLMPIVFEGGTGTRGRKRLKRQTKGDIDDGCMRSIAMTVHGLRQLNIYFGVPKTKTA